MNANIRTKGLATGGAVSVAFALLFVAADPTTSQYEITVYDSYPTIFWVALFVGGFLGLVTIVESGALTERRRYWKWGFALVLSVVLILVTIPLVRYFTFARGDMLTFIGMIRHIGATGEISSTNYYPSLHLLGLTLAGITGLSVRTVINALPPVATLFYFVSIYELITVLVPDRRTQLFVLPFAALPLFKSDFVLFSPSAFGFKFIPLALYLLFRSYRVSSSERFSFAFLLFVVAIVFYHPAITLFFVGILGLLKLSTMVDSPDDDGFTLRKHSTPMAAAFALVIFFVWYYSFESILASTLIVLFTLVGLSQGSPTASQISSVLSGRSLELTDVVLYGINSYGVTLPLICIAGLFLAYHLSLRMTNRRSFGLGETFVTAVFLVYTAGTFMVFFVDVVLGSGRIERYVRLVAPVLVGIGFASVHERVDRRTVSRYLRSLLYLSLFVLLFTSMFQVYGSPLSNGTNAQVTEAEMEGMEWFFSHRDDSMVTDELGISQRRFYHAIYQEEQLGENVRRENTMPPPHFNYSNESEIHYLSDAVDSRRYLLVTRLGRIQNPRLHPGYRQFWRHGPRDFRRLERDSSFAHVYDNGQFDAYVVHGVGNSTTSNDTRAASPRG